MILPPPPVPALVNVDDRTRMRLTSSRHKLTVAGVARRSWCGSRRSTAGAIRTTSRSGASAGTGSRRRASCCLDETRRFRIRLKPGRYVLYCTIAAGTALSHERLGMRDALRVVRRS